MPTTLRLADDLPSLLGPIRLDVFASVDRLVGSSVRSRVVSSGVAWQAWNPDPQMADRMARLPGSGSFYWPNAIRAYHAAIDIMRGDARVQQIKLATISGREIGRMYRRHTERN